MSSTTSATPSSTTVMVGNGGGGGSFLGSGGSTLILAFLAIGLFVGGLLVMFSMRRYVVRNRRRLRAWNTTGDQPWAWDETQLGPPTLLTSMNVYTRRQDEFGEKPELWEVSSTTLNWEEEKSWGKIMVRYMT